MTFEDYSLEIKKSSLNIENIDNIIEEFKGYQNLALDTLREFHRLCEDNEINYQLAYGSLLGAIRDNGQLPWDYDIDVFVPYEQKAKLLKVLRTQLNEKFYFVGPETDPHCVRGIIRVTPKGYNSDFLHVDVFYLAGIPEDEVEAATLRNMLTKIQKYRYARFINPFSEAHGDIKKLASLIFGKIKNYTFKWNYYAEQYEKLCTQCPTNVSKYLVDTGLWANHCKYDKDDILNTVLFTTRDGTFRIPVGYENILSMGYGNYRKYMPLEDRVSEMLHNYWKLKKYGKL